MVNRGSHVDIYGVRVEYDINVNMGIFEPVYFLRNALAYKPITPLEIQGELRGLPRDQGVEYLEGILRSPVKEDWTPPAGLHGQPANLNAVRTELNASIAFARDALVALGEMEAPRRRRID
jgi:hypothetical protein